MYCQDPNDILSIPSDSSSATIDCATFVDGKTCINPLLTTDPLAPEIIDCTEIVDGRICYDLVNFPDLLGLDPTEYTDDALWVCDEPLSGKKCYDLTGADIICDDYIWDVIHEYTVKVPRSIWTASVEAILHTNINSTATVEFSYPDDVQLSNTPLHGKYWIECYREDGAASRTADISYDTGDSGLYSALVAGCPWLRDNIDIVDEDDIYFKEDGIDWRIYFNRMSAGLSQFIFHSSDTDVLSGNDVTIYENELKPYGPNAMIDVLPFEMLFTAETQPQVIVMIDDYPALCATTECGYVYESTAALITGVAVTGTNVVLTGVSLPIDDIISIKFGQELCVTSSTSETSITCDLESAWVGGQWFPKILTSKGLVPYDDVTVSAYVVTPTIDSVSPTIFNPAGGETVVITGTGYPLGLDTEHELSVTFSDGTVCDI